MDTAQTLLTQGATTQRVATVASTVTSIVPWIALAVVSVLIVLVFLKKRK